MKKFVLIDANALIHRAYHALPKTFKAPNGQLTNAAYGFTSIILGILEHEKPDYFAAAFDMKGKTFRDDMMESYKATRVKTDDELISQFPIIRSVVRSFSIPIFEKEGLEADDYLGIVSRELEEMGDIGVLIVTNDQDAFQLVSEKTTVVSPISGYTKVKRYDRAAVMEKLGVWPEQVPDYKGLRGDNSDNIPGVPGIGKVGATKLLKEFTSLEGIYDAIDTVQPERIRGLLKEHEESARLSKKVATILREDGLDFVLEDCAVHDFDIEVVRSLFEELAFRTPLRRVEALNSSWQVSLF